MSTTGSRRRRLRFERKVSAPDGLGNDEGAFQPLCGPFWATLTPLVGGEEVLAQRLDGVQPYTASLRCCEALLGVTVADRAVDDRSGELFDIKAITNPDGRNAQLAFLLKSGTTPG